MWNKYSSTNNLYTTYMYITHGRFLTFFKKILIWSFCSRKIAWKKGLRNIFFYYLRKLSRFWGQFSSTALEQSNIWHKSVYIINTVLENWPQNRGNFLMKLNIYISRYSFNAILYEQKFQKNYLSILIMSTYNVHIFHVFLK